MNLEDYAVPDLDRVNRRGMSEVIYGAGKSAAQIIGIIKALNQAGQNACATRVSPEQAAEIKIALPGAAYHAVAGLLTCDVAPLPEKRGCVSVICAGTSDIKVAEEAAMTAERLGVNVNRVYDVGVAGLHRLLSRLDQFKDADVLIVVAGMEGALPSVVGGLTAQPLIAVPTSVGYGASFGGIAALLGMLNSCAAGITVVNIDNGFGAAVAAALIVRRII
ncbi:MAG: nickel pincer cofactor biosynthesis protein LarB [Kiritimatiellae bacterium]|nr:nickel pincer cofactor biosynthesis protein LarB [Kiritimatiellia bacterium]